MELCEKCFSHDSRLEKFIVKVGKMNLQLTLCRSCSIDMKNKYNLISARSPSETSMSNLSNVQ